MGAKVRGAVKPEKTQTGWRILKDHIPRLEKEAVRLGLGSVPAAVNHILAVYFNKLEKGE